MDIKIAGIDFVLDAERRCIHDILVLKLKDHDVKYVGDIRDPDVDRDVLFQSIKDIITNKDHHLMATGFTGWRNQAIGVILRIPHKNNKVLIKIRCDIDYMSNAEFVRDLVNKHDKDTRFKILEDSVALLTNRLKTLEGENKAIRERLKTLEEENKRKT